MAIGEHFNFDNLIPFLSMISAPMLAISSIFLMKGILANKYDKISMFGFYKRLLYIGK